MALTGRLQKGEVFILSNVFDVHAVYPGIPQMHVTDVVPPKRNTPNGG